MDRRWRVVAAGTALACAISVLALRGPRPRYPRAPGAARPRNLGHRGASSRVPENTLESFRAALEDGAGGLELDVHLTWDGQVVVLHDATVDRTTDGAGPVTELTFARLRGLDAGHRFTPDGTTYPHRGRGVRVPTLAEVYESFPGVAINMDIKAARPGAQAAVLEIVRGFAAEARTLVASEQHAVISRFRRLSGGEVPTAASRREIRLFYLLSALRLERLARPAYEALQVPPVYRGLPVITRRFLTAAWRNRVRVDAWTIDDPAEMRRLLDLGVDGIMTNKPAALAVVLAERSGSAYPVT